MSSRKKKLTAKAAALLGDPAPKPKTKQKAKAKNNKQKPIEVGSDSSEAAEDIVGEGPRSEVEYASDFPSGSVTDRSNDSWDTDLTWSLIQAITDDPQIKQALYP